VSYRGGKSSNTFWELRDHGDFFCGLFVTFSLKWVQICAYKCINAAYNESFNGFEETLLSELK
jgi:hypothetical protein